MMTIPQNDNLVPDTNLIRAFVHFLFDGCTGWVAVRQFAEKGQPAKPPRTPFFPVDADLPERVIDEAGRASADGLGLYVIPGTVAAEGRAKAADVTSMSNVLVDL